MKLSLQQANRRSNSFRSLEPSADGTIRSPATLAWLIFHSICCLISLLLGFRFSRLVFFFLSSSAFPYTSNFHSSPILRTATLTLQETPYVGHLLNVNTTPNITTTSSRVVVGRHGIRIRPWPHPNPDEVMKAHRIIQRVQREQRVQYGIKNPKRLIAVTPTYVRTFQAMHLRGVMHSLMNVPYEVVWIVVESGGVTNETAGIVEKSGLRILHVGYDQRMPSRWEDRHKLETLMRIRALRLIREEKMDGMVIFADDSNMHSLEFFDEIQKVKWIGALSMGILISSENMDCSTESRDDLDGTNPPLPIQGPACNSSDKLAGWHTFNPLPYLGKAATSIDEKAAVLPQKFEWSGFVINSRLLWNDAKNNPKWVKDIDFGEVAQLESPLDFLKEHSFVEPLGDCGRKVLLWWLRVEARSDSRFPSGWVLNQPLEITVPSRRTPWPGVPPKLPYVERVSTDQDRSDKRNPRNRVPRLRRSSRAKRKHGGRAAEVHDSAMLFGDQ